MSSAQLPCDFAEELNNIGQQVITVRLVSTTATDNGILDGMLQEVHPDHIIVQSQQRRVYVRLDAIAYVWQGQ